MSNASTRVDTRAERLQPWIAALISALLHVLMLLVLLLASTPTVTTPQGAASGGRMKVDLIGRTPPSEQPARTPPSPPPSQAPAPVPTPPAASPVRSTLVRHADDPLPPDTADRPDTLATRRPPTPVQRLSEPQPPRSRDDPTQNQAQAPAASPAPAQRRPETWTGRPPGLIEEDVAPDDEGLARSSSINRGNRHDLDAAEPSLEIGGYLVYYDLHSETLLRTWMGQGMKELSIPLPGTRYYMICPVQVALDRGSGKCRLLAPDSPELQAIGDAREVINMIQVYRRGELVWRGPGPYR